MARRESIDPKEHARERSRLLEIILKMSFERREFTLSSGRKSNYYIDGKQTTLNPEGMLLAGKLLYRRIRSLPAKVDAVGGLTLGADPLVCAVALVSQLEGTPIPAYIVRKEAKGHGTGAWIEGIRNVPGGARVVVIEDVVTSGDSSLRAIARSEEAGFTVVRVLALVDRQEGGREKLKEKGYELDAVYTRDDLIAG